MSRLVKTDHLAIPTSRLVPADRRRDCVSASLVVILDSEGPARVTDVDVAVAAEEAIAATYENEDMDGALQRYADAGLVDLDGHREAARRGVEGFLVSAGRVVRVRVPRADDPRDAERWLLDAVAGHLPV